MNIFNHKIKIFLLIPYFWNYLYRIKVKISNVIKFKVNFKSANRKLQVWWHQMIRRTTISTVKLALSFPKALIHQTLLTLSKSPRCFLILLRYNLMRMNLAWQEWAKETNRKSIRKRSRLGYYANSSFICSLHGSMCSVLKKLPRKYLCVRYQTRSKIRESKS